MDDRPMSPTEPDGVWPDLSAADTPELESSEWDDSLSTPPTPPTPLTSPATSVTGHPEVDAALAILDRIDGAPPEEQLAVYQAVHRTLQETLATIDEE